MAKGLVEAVIDQQPWLDGISDAAQPVIRKAFESGGQAGRTVKDLLNGVWLGHPLHPVITDVPIGAWTLSILFDALSIAKGGDKMLDDAADIAMCTGILAAVGAAVTGITDWSDADGKQRRIGTAHALLNVGGLTLNLAGLALRRGGGRGLGRVFTTLGYLTSSTAAYVAGELVYNLGMAVSRNSWVDRPTEFKDVAAAEELADGKMHKYTVSGSPVVLVQHEDGVHAFGGTCSHFGCYLWQSELKDHVVTCDCHGSQFDIRDGSVVHGPATDPVPHYEVKEMIGRIYVKLGD